MAQTPMPKTAKGISNGSAKMATGIDQVGTSVPVTAITATQMRTNRAAFDSAENAFNTGRKTVSDAYKTFHTSEADLTEWLGTTRLVLAGNFGQRWSTDWAAAGFVNHSTAVPRQIGDRIGLTNNLVAFFTANPGYEVASLDVTAAYAETLYTAATTSQSGVSTAEHALDTLDTARGAARVTVLGGMRALVKNLEGALAANDPRWLNFGLAMPAARVTPAKPTGLVVIRNGADSAQVSCDPAPRATRYRWRRRIVGPGNVFALAASTTEPLAILSPLPMGMTVEIIAQAVNDGLQSVPSDPVTLTIPALSAPEAKTSAPAKDPAVSVASKPNGQATGHGHGPTANGQSATNGKGSRGLSRA